MTTLNVLATLTVTPDCTMLLVGNVALVALVALGSLVAGRISAARTMALAADTTPATAKTEQAVLGGNPCWSTSGTIESDDTCCDLTGSWATPSVCATIPVAVLAEQVRPRAYTRALVEALPVLESHVGALCYGLDAIIGQETGPVHRECEAPITTAWTLVDRFTGSVKANVWAEMVQVNGSWTATIRTEVR